MSVSSSSSSSSVVESSNDDDESSISISSTEEESDHDNNNNSDNGNNNEVGGDDDEYIRSVRLWVEQIPIGLGLCPWAVKSKIHNNITYKTCYASDNVTQVSTMVVEEAKRLLCSPYNSDVSLALKTTLIICPFVKAFETFGNFEEFVHNLTKKRRRENEEDDDDSSFLRDNITLVCFHPKFLRWHGLPTDGSIDVGTTVQSYRPSIGGVGGFQKSTHKETATVLETYNKMFGRRKIKLRFESDSKQLYVPIDWFIDAAESGGVPLPDNAMHQSPYPTIHLIRNMDLASLRIKDVSRVKRKNCVVMMKLGWNGIEAAKINKTKTEKGKEVENL